MKQTHDNSIENEQGVETHNKTMNVTAKTQQPKKRA